MGAVYDAWDTALGVRRAIKENLLFTDVHQRQFEREARLLARLHHPNLPRVGDHFLIPNQGQYLVMDFVEGEDLRQRLERLGPLPEADVRLWAESILNALAYLQKRNIVHRDIKPANIKITPEGEAMLVDFGIAKEIETTTGGATTAGAHGMTPGYAPPEQYGLGTARTDARSDLYSLGATLYALLSGEVPTDVLSRLTQPEKFIPLSRRQLNVSPAFAAAIDKALELDPAARFASANEMKAALRGEPFQTAEASTLLAPAGLGEGTPTAPTRQSGPARVRPTAPSVSAPRPKFNWLLWGGLGVGAVIVVGLLIGLPGGGIMPLALAPTPSLTPSVTPTPTPRIEATATPTPVPTATSTITPTPTDTPTSTLTPVGGGRGEIAFVSQRDGNPEIYVMNVDGSNVRRLTNNTVNDTSPAWSPDGALIAFVSRRHGNSEIYVMNADGSNVRRLTSHSAGDFSPAWSPDGKKIVFTSGRDGTDTESNGEVYVMNADGSEQTRLTFSAGDDLHPIWSPDGAKIAFVSDRLSVGDIYVMNPDGSQPTRLTTQGGQDPAWSPDGSQIAYYAQRGPKIEIWVMSPLATNQRRLTTAPAHAYHPVWSADGTRIAFVSDAAAHVLDPADTSRLEIYVMNADGSAPLRLTENDVYDGLPAWSP